MHLKIKSFSTATTIMSTPIHTKAYTAHTIDKHKIHKITPIMKKEFIDMPNDILDSYITDISDMSEENFSEDSLLNDDSLDIMPSPVPIEFPLYHYQKETTASLCTIDSIYSTESDLKHYIPHNAYNCDIYETRSRVVKGMYTARKKWNLPPHNELLLLHGTSITNALQIVINGFNAMKTIGGPFGRGIYFTHDKESANLYSGKKTPKKTNYLPIESRQRCILVCKVLLGTIYTHKKNVILPDTDEPFPHHHSCMGEVQNNTIYTVYDPTRICPMYLIAYDIKTPT